MHLLVLFGLEPVLLLQMRQFILTLLNLPFQMLAFPQFLFVVGLKDLVFSPVLVYLLVQNIDFLLQGAVQTVQSSGDVFEGFVLLPQFDEKGWHGGLEGINFILEAFVLMRYFNDFAQIEVVGLANGEESVCEAVVGGGRVVMGVSFGILQTYLWLHI